MKRLTILFLFIFVPCVCFSQQRMRAIKVKEDTYIHSNTGFAFPKEISGFDREAVYAFDKKKENVGADYVSGSTKVSVFVYPADNGYEDRLRKEFFRSLEGILMSEDTEGQHFKVKCVSHQSGQRRIHGLLAAYDYMDQKSLVSLYECGHWWLKFRITDNDRQETCLDSIEVRFRNSLTPERLISSKPLADEFDINFRKTAFRDSLMLGCVMGQAYAKVNWMKENLDSLELQAGIPSLYLGYHLSGIDGALDFAQKHPEMSSSPATRSMLDFIVAAKKEGYLEELFYEEKRGGILIPDGLVLDLDGYHKWLTDHPFNGDLLYENALISNE